VTFYGKVYTVEGALQGMNQKTSIVKTIWITLHDTNETRFRKGKIMTHDLYKEVAIVKNLPQYNLQSGDVGTVVEVLSRGDKKGYAIEFFNAVGESVAVAVVDEADIQPLKEDEILHVRKLQAA